MERKGTNLGNVPLEKEKAEKHTLPKQRSMWKQRPQKEEETS
jgi:hypothetical protein